MVGWHHQLSGHESEQTPGDSKGQRILACCHPQGHKESETTERLNNNRARWSLLLGFPVTQLVKNLPAMQETPV